MKNAYLMGIRQLEARHLNRFKEIVRNMKLSRLEQLLNISRPADLISTVEMWRADTAMLVGGDAQIKAVDKAVKEVLELP